MTNETLIAAVRTLERRAEHLEQEAALLRRGLGQFREAIELSIIGTRTDRVTIETENEGRIND